METELDVFDTEGSEVEIGTELEAASPGNTSSHVFKSESSTAQLFESLAPPFCWFEDFSEIDTATYAISSR